MTKKTSMMYNYDIHLAKVLYTENKKVYIEEPDGKLKEYNENIIGIASYVFKFHNAHMISNWFENKRYHEDNHGTVSCISLNQLKELLSDINKVLLNHSLTDELLPNQVYWQYEGYKKEAIDQNYFNILCQIKDCLEVEIEKNDDCVYQFWITNGK